MLTPLHVLAALWVAVAALSAPTLVPSAMSGATFGWLNVLCAGALAVIVLTARNARPASSIAQVLYDAEHRRERG
ncbi:MAG: hypothetical protein ACRD09_13265 [Vicinamibacterales bacterium]